MPPQDRVGHRHDEFNQLEKMNAALLVTTSTALVSIENGNPRAVHTGSGIYFGLTWDRNHVYVLCRNNLHHGGIRRLFGYTSSIEVFDKNFRHVDTVQCPTVRDPHQAIEKDGAIYIANTGKDRIEVCRDGDFSSIGWTGERADVHHINTIWHDDTAFYALENNKQEPSDARIFDHDWRPRQTVPLGLGAHNLFRSGKTLYTCSSLERTMRSHNLESGQSREFSLLGREWLPRGLAKGAGLFYIGLSAEGTRRERHGGMPGRIIATDDEFKITDTLDLDGVGQVNEVRLLSELDAAHNGVPF